MQVARRRVKHLTATFGNQSDDRTCHGNYEIFVDTMTNTNITTGVIDTNAQDNLDSVAESLLATAIQHQALTPAEARSLASWDLSTITEYLALRLQKHGLITAQECRAVLGIASESEH